MQIAKTTVKLLDIMEFGRYERLIVGLGLPVLIFELLANDLGVEYRLQMAVGLAWIGTLGTLLLLSRSRKRLKRQTKTFPRN